MALTPGTRLGVYEVTAQIGEGGMGQVYRATDTKLKRQVAIKILPPSLAADADRLARFQREAEVLASLNHPHIAAIYGLEEADGVKALVMELVEGEDLSQRIARGAIPMDEALPIAKQIAEALEAAHEQGIIHRDLKPANIKVRADGTVKVLDFGLAKAKEPATRSSSSVSMSPTITTPAMTQAGTILGTAAYMSPEQARGKSVDKRADIWAFGAVLFEMLTGTRAFPGEETTDTIVSIVGKEPDWSALPTRTPEGLRRLLTHCLKKDAKARMRDIGEARQELEHLLGGVPDEMVTAASVATSPTVASTRRRLVAAASVTLLMVAAVLGTRALMRTPPAKLQPMRFVIALPAEQPLKLNSQFPDRDLSLSPDGTHLVYVSGTGRLMLRTMSQLDAVPLSDITDARSPFFSPDSRWVGVFTGGVLGNTGELKKVSIAGGPALSLCRYQGAPRGASWGLDDVIVFATNDSNSGLLRVSAAGGEPTVLTTPDTAHGEADHLFPSILPGGRAVLFTIRAPSMESQVAVVDLTTGHRTILIRAGSQAEYVDTGHLVYALAGTLRAVRFDLATRIVESDPVSVVERVITYPNGAAEFSVSRQGTLVYVPGSGPTEAPRSLVWVTRQGHEDSIAAPPRAYTSARLSPDGSRVALGFDSQEGIWIWDLARKTLTRLTDTPAFDQGPVWTPDGRRVIFASSSGGISNLFWRAADNTSSVQRLTTSPNAQVPTSIAPDGTRVIVQEIVPTTGADLRVLRLEGPSARTGATPATALTARQTEPLLQTTFNESSGAIAPDGRWLAYESNDSGPVQISVRPFPDVESGHWTISAKGGTRPTWARSGQELFYLDGNNAVTAVSVHTTPSFVADTPLKLFDGPYYSDLIARSYDVSLDGQRFLMIKNTASGDQPSTPASIVVVVNWVEELKAKVPTGK